MLAVPTNYKLDDFPDLTTIDAKLELLNAILAIDERTADDTSNEIVINEFIKRIIRGGSSISDNLEKHPETAASTWRTIYEAAVLFRIMTQPMAVTNDYDTFCDLVQRYNDYGIIATSDAFGYRNDRVKYEVINRYKAKGPDDILLYEYDWSNPVFTHQNLQGLQNPYHPSFRDLVYRTNETDSLLVQLLGNYKLSSNLIHMTIITEQVMDEFNREEIEEVTNEILTIFIKDYIAFLIGLYKSSTSNNKDAILKLLNGWQKQIILNT